MGTPAPAESRTAGQEQRQFRAFVQDDATRTVVDQVVRELAIPSAAVHKGGVREAMKLLGEQRSPRILVVDLAGVELPLSAVNELAEVCEPGVTLIATGDRNDVGLFRELIGNGVSDYLVKPITAPLLQRSLLNVMDSTNQARPSDRRGRLVAVAGTRGGVGTTTLATGIAWTIAQRRRRRAALVDLDLQYGNVALGLDLEPATGLREALEQPGRIDALFVDRAMIAYSDTLHVLSGEEPLAEPICIQVEPLDILIRDLRNKFHYVVVDVPHQVSAATRYIMSSATDLVIVTDLSVSGIRDTLRQVAMVPADNAACRLAIVANRTGEQRFGAIGAKEFAAAIGRPIDFQIPSDLRSVVVANNLGKSAADGKSKVALAIQQLAETITGKDSSDTAKRRPRLWRLGRR